jgi:hypothetical protein
MSVKGARVTNLPKKELNLSWNQLEIGKVYKIVKVPNEAYMGHLVYRLDTLSKNYLLCLTHPANRNIFGIECYESCYFTPVEVEVEYKIIG